jgi:hypothetical protein
MIPDIPKL